ncbi:MAG: hypothetical protein QXH07_01285 [Thermoplasmata archaeon]
MTEEKDMDNEVTTVRLRKTTVKKLENLKLVDSESIESVVLRIIEYAPNVKIVLEPKPNNTETYIGNNNLANKETAKQ